MARKKAIKKAAKKPAKRPAKKTVRIARPQAAEQSVLVHMCVGNGVEALDFYKAAFGAKELHRLVQPGGKIAHAEFKIGNTMMILADEQPQHQVFAPPKFGGCSATINLRVRNADAAVDKAVAAGAKLVSAPQTGFSGSRMGVVEDPYGYAWFITAQLEKVSPREVQKRFDKLMAAR